MNRARMQLIVALLGLSIFPTMRTPARMDENPYDRIRAEHELVEKSLHREGRIRLLAQPKSLRTPAQAIDVSHYRLQIHLDPDTSSLGGTVTIKGKARDRVSSIAVDAFDNLVIDGVRVGGIARAFERRQQQVIIGLPGGLEAGAEFVIEIDYQGRAETIGSLGGGMLVTVHGPENVPVMASLSEPYAAPSWWPCIDDATDKATANIEATVGKGYSVASNGVLDRVERNGDGGSTYFWREDYPISTYLISVAATNYERFEDVYTAMDHLTRMPMEYFVYPEHVEMAVRKFAVTRRAMEIFAPLYGEYPFLNEKYGMAEFPWGGAMEHQTMTSLGSRIVGSETSTGEGVIAHELAHHWWGDLVTMKSWHDIWLNEGFATYSEVLFYERFYGMRPGELMAHSYDDGEVYGRMGGTVYAEDITDPYDDTGAIYTKGGWVLHMLRGILGESAFFGVLKDYAGRYGFSNASTRDFQDVCEEHYGASLGWFFDEWIYAPGRPIYKVTSTIRQSGEANHYTVTVTIKQKQGHEIPGRTDESAFVYIMPIDVTLRYADGTSEIRTILNDARKQTVSFDVVKRATGVGFDEGNRVLKKLKLRAAKILD